MDIPSLERHGSAIALVDPVENKTITYQELALHSQKWLGQLPPASNHIFIFSIPSIDAIALTIAALVKGDAVHYLDSTLKEEEKQALIQAEQPTHLFEDNQLRLTGFPASQHIAIEHNETIHSILETLLCQPQDRMITALPLHHPFGLALIKTYLKAGGSIVLNRYTVVEPEFWSLIQRTRCTSLHGTSAMVRLLYKIGFERFELPFLKTMVLVGNDLEENITSRFQQLMKGRGGRFFLLNDPAVQLTEVPAN